MERIDRSLAGIALGLTSLSTLAVESAPTGISEEQCLSLTTMTLPDGVSFSSVQAITRPDHSDMRFSEAQKAEFVPYCRLVGEFEKRTGAGGEPYAIGFGLNLPFDWNGRLLFQGGGGLNGLVREPLGGLASGDTPALFRGFAVASTDSGHQSDSVFDPAFFADQQALLNFWSGAVAKTTVLVRQLVEDVYGTAPEHNYFAGCSTGGREAMTMSQRYPHLFDGIIAGAPARVTNLSEIADLFSARTLRDVSKNNQPPFSEEQQKHVVDGLLAKCDGLDGSKDGFIFGVEGCDFSPESLICGADSDADACLTPSQADALSQAFAGPKDSRGKNVYPGFYFDTGIDDKSSWGAPGLLHAEPGPLGRARIDEPFDIDRELAIANGFPLEPGNATLTNLSTFAGEQGKLMFFHGVSDPWFSAQDTLGYFNAMTQANGGAEQVSQWSQFYFVPGMGHCGGGERTLDSFDMLSALVNWVEQGKVPLSVTATGRSAPGESRPLCPYPQVSTYNGSGDPALAESYHCAAN